MVYDCCPEPYIDITATIFLRSPFVQVKKPLPPLEVISWAELGNGHPLFFPIPTIDIPIVGFLRPIIDNQIV